MRHLLHHPLLGNRKLRAGAIVVAAIAVVAILLAIVKPDAPMASAPPTAAPSALTVNATTPRMERWPQTVAASGPLMAWQEIIVSPETGGLRIAEIRADVGDRVTRGQLLVQLADDTVRADLRKQEAALAQARANLEQAVSNSERARLVEGAGVLSEQQIEDYRIKEVSARASLASTQADVDATRLRLAQTRVVAADDGVVTSKSAVLGNVVNAGAELFRMLRQSRVEWHAELDARQLVQVSAGDLAYVTLPTGMRVAGKVRIVAPALSTATGRAVAYVSLPEESPARAGMFGSGTIELAEKAAMTVPQSAVVTRDGRQYVYLVDAEGKVASRPVTTGRRRGERIEIVSGVSVDARIVASGGAFLSEGTQVTVQPTEERTSPAVPENTDAARDSEIAQRDSTQPERTR